jgi:hypothetical protein
MERLTWIGSIHFSSQLSVGSSEQCGSTVEAASSAALGSALPALAARCLHPYPQRRPQGIPLVWGRLRWCRVPRPREARHRCWRTHRGRGANREVRDAPTPRGGMEEAPPPQPRATVCGEEGAPPPATICRSASAATIWHTTHQPPVWSGLRGARPRPASPSRGSGVASGRGGSGFPRPWGAGGGISPAYDLGLWMVTEGAGQIKVMTGWEQSTRNFRGRGSVGCT